tara:strand:+ start:19315 stop:20067 length:753 start_codon:yes stop_codon:yes gene_type:complete
MSKWQELKDSGKIQDFRVIGDAVCLLGDCMDVLPFLDVVDCVITDPPYSEKTHIGARAGRGEDVLIDFDSISDHFFLMICRSLVNLSARWVVMTCDWRHAAHAEKEMPGEFIRAGIWVKPNGMPQFTGDRPSTGWEAVAIMHKKGKKRWNGGGSHAVWIVPKVHGNHPTEKPIFLISKFLELFSDPGDVIFDPFMGSGTTGVAATQLGRKFIGIEREPKYFAIACERIENAQRQENLFKNEEKPEQEILF